MKSTNSLRARFDKVHRESMEAEEISKKTESVERVPLLELKESSRAEVHQELRASACSSYDWKKQLKKTFKRPSIEICRTKSMTDVEWTLQHLTKNSAIITFNFSDKLEPELLKTSSHMKQHPSFWKTMLESVQHLHIHADRNKLSLSLTYKNSDRDHKTEVRTVLEREYLSKNDSIKTFRVSGQENWVEITLDLITSQTQSRSGEASL